MGSKDTPRQESHVRTLKVMTQSHDQRILSFKDTPSELMSSSNFVQAVSLTNGEFIKPVWFTRQFPVKPRVAHTLSLLGGMLQDPDPDP